MYISAYNCKIALGLYNMFTGALIQEINLPYKKDMYNIVHISQIEIDLEKNQQIFILDTGEKKIAVWNANTFFQISASIGEQWMKGNSRIQNFAKRRHVLNDPSAFVLYENFLYILDSSHSIKIFSTLPGSFGLFISQLKKEDAGWRRMHIHENRLILDGIGNPRLTVFV